MTWKRQLRTTILLLLLIAACLGAAFYFRLQTQTPTAALLTSDAEPVMQEVNDAIKRYENRSAEDLATLRTSADENTPEKAELVFEGLSDAKTTQSLLDSLAKNNLSASFYVTGEDATANLASLSLIADAGYTIGTAYTETTYAMDSVAAKRAMSDFVRSSATIQTVVGVWPSQILSLSKPSNEVLAAAFACSMTTVIVPSKIINLGDAATAELAQTLVGGLPRTSILCVKLSKTEAKADTAFTTLFSALAATDLGARAQNVMYAHATSAEPLQRVYTTERSVAFTFSGLGNDAELKGVLDALKAVNGKATFFVTADELIRYPDEVKEILDGGHSLGMSVQASRFTNATALLEELYKTQETLQTTFAYTGELAVRPAFGSAPELLKQACGAGGFTLLSAMVNAVRTEDIRITDATPVLDALFPELNGALQRGEIVHFQMNQYQKSNALLGDLVKQLAAKRNIYSLKPIMEIAKNTDYIYQYPLPDASILPAVKNKIYPGQLNGSIMTAIATRYIGVDWVATSAFLPGFSSTEIKRLDKTGLVPNNSNMVFLTFDDWGTDKTITELLDVLKAHKAKATFFVRTQNVVYNPNLLRAIAADGHTIGCHTHTHFPLSVDDGSGRRFSELTEDQVSDLKQDLVTSYTLLQSIVGDLKSGTHPSLSLLFRPPTLAVSKAGLTAVFDCGFTYSVSGTYSSQDYKASSATKLAADLKKNTESGAVLVMHMSDGSLYTAEALDIYLSEMERKETEKPYKFVGLSEVLQ